MDKSLFPDGVEVNQDALKTAEDAKEFHIQRRASDMAQAGRASGLVVSINGTLASRFDVSAGHGYTPRGDYVEHAGATSIALADYATGVENLLVLIYKEEGASPQAHEDGGTRNTIMHRSSELRAMARTEYDGLVAYEDADFATNLTSSDYSRPTRDRVMVLASILGKGITVGVPNTYVSADLTNGNITQSPLFDTSIKTATLPEHANLSGINIVGLTNTAHVGNGYLQLHWNDPDWRLSWYTPNNIGTSVTSPSPANYETIPASAVPQEIEITSETAANTTASTITVEVMTSLFPPAELLQPHGFSTLTAAVTVATLYDESSEVFSAEDRAHRVKVGSYSPKATEPHGIGLSDIAQQVAIVPQQLVVGTGLLSTEAEALRPKMSVPRSVVAGVDRTEILAVPGGTGGTVRLYSRPDASLEITLNARWNGTAWAKDVGAVSWMLDFRGSLTGYEQTSTLVTTTWTTWSNSKLDNMGSIALGTNLLLAGQFTEPRINVTRGDGSSYQERTRLLRSQGSTGRDVSVYLGTNTIWGDTLEIVVNAFWSSPNWVRVTAGQPATRVVIGKFGIHVGAEESVSATFSDGAWSNHTICNPLDDVHEFAGDVTLTSAAKQFLVKGSTELEQMLEVGTSTAAKASEDTPRIYIPVSSGSTSNPRYLISEYKQDNLGFREYVYNEGNPDYYAIERAFNCYWDPTAGTSGRWKIDTGGPISNFGRATLHRWYPFGFDILTQAGAVTEWDHTLPPTPGVGWSHIKCRLAGDSGVTAGYETASELRNGRLHFTDASPTMSNPTAGSNVTANALTALNVPKAWVSGSIGPAGSNLVWDGYGIEDIQSVTVNLGSTVTSGLELVISAGARLQPANGSGNVCVVGTMELADGLGNQTSVNFVAPSTSRTTSTIVICADNPIGTFFDLTNLPGTQTAHFNVTIFGRRSNP